MQLIGFNLTKISASKKESFKKSALDLDIEFTNVEKQKLDILKDSDAVKISFKHVLSYLNNEEKKESQGEVSFEGHLMLNVTKEELQTIIKTWKKKILPENITYFVSNLILKRCSPKAFQLQEELGLPTHVRVPSVRMRTN